MQKFIAKKIYCHQSGFTLVELMIAATLGLFLLGGLVQLVGNLKQTHRVQESISRIQETARFAIEFITQEARQVGFFGCANFRNMTFTNNLDPAIYTTGIESFDGSNNLKGYNDVTAGSVIEGIVTVGTANANAIAGTDLLYTRNGGPLAGGEIVTVGSGTSPSYSGTAQLKIANATLAGLAQDDIVIVTNCSHADMFGITNNPVNGGGTNPDSIAHANSNNTSSKIKGVYGEGAELLSMQSTVVYLGVGMSGTNALFRKSPGGNAEEIIEGVEDMQIIYGKDTNGDGSPNYYFRAGSGGIASTDMDNVVSMRVSLLITSLDDNLTLTNQTYTFNGVTTTATDRRIYRVYTTTIALRNRLS